MCGTLSVIALLYTRANDFGSADPPLPPGYTAFFQVLRHTYCSFCVSSFCIICWATLHSAAEASRCNRFCREFSGTCFKNCFARQVGPLLPLLDGPREHVESVWAERGGGGGAKREEAGRPKHHIDVGWQCAPLNRHTVPCFSRLTTPLCDTRDQLPPTPHY